MGYFDGLSDGSFKLDRQGRWVFYPWGALGKGYVLPDEARKDRIRQFVKRYLLVTLPLSILFGVAFSNVALSRRLTVWTGVLIGLLPLDFVGSIVFYGWRTARLLEGFRVSEEKLRIAEAYRNSAKSHNLAILIFFFVLSALFVVAGLWLISQNRVMVGALSVALFGACTVGIGFMLKAKLAH